MTINTLADQPIRETTLEVCGGSASIVNPMVVRVAQAIAAEEGHSWATMPARRKVHYGRYASAAIKAMRAPTEGMLAVTDFLKGRDEYPLTIWEDMIDAALAQPGAAS